MSTRSRGARRPRFCKNRSRLDKQRAQGMPGALCTHSLACNVKVAHERSHHRYTGITRHSPRNGFTAYIVLSPATNSCCHRHPRIKVLSARSGRLASANLAPATGARTTRLAGTGKHMHLIWVSGEAKYFLFRGLTRFLKIRSDLPVGQNQQPTEAGTYHSITSSASARSVGGIVRPSAFAVLRLMTNSNLDGWTTGKSAGFSPLRMSPV